MIFIFTNRKCNEIDGLVTEMEPVVMAFLRCWSNIALRIHGVVKSNW